VFKECTAVVCYNDTVAQHILEVLDDPAVDSTIKAVYSFDHHLPLRSNRGIETHSIGYPKSDIGEIIGHKLLDMMGGVETDSLMLPWLQ
ncbi:MAG: hypothetical protein IKX27_05390, partial [Oscillospiraceae bacterium]|nr:hypothetical protein [Oscillospiraceae bacterium]